MLLDVKRPPLNRFWEKEFDVPEAKKKKIAKGIRKFTPQDI